jgi:5-methylcytosine-specific restriction endonuclease McrA
MTLNRNDPSGTCVWDLCAVEGVGAGVAVSILVGVATTLIVAVAYDEFGNRVRDNEIAQASESKEGSGEQPPNTDGENEEQAKAEPKAGSAGGPGSGKRFSDKTRDTAEKEANGQCVFCGNKTKRDSGEKQRNTDHSIPKSRGGNNSLDNAQNTCRKCNRDKGAQTTEEYLKRRQE